MHALVVDDVAANRDILALMLGAIGAQVALAESGPQALEKARQQRPDIVFMDIRMPGMDGVETRRRLIAEHGESAFCVVAVTASAFVHQRQQFLDAGFDDFIDKPFRAGRIYACLAEFLGVAFERAAPDGDEETADADDWRGLILPAQRRASLETAVKMHSVTQLNEQLDRLAAEDETFRPLVARLRQLVRRFDMKAVAALLAEIPHA